MYATFTLPYKEQSQYLENEIYISPYNKSTGDNCGFKCKGNAYISLLKSYLIQFQR